MSINIKNREAERLLAELAKKNHMGKSELVLELLRREAIRQARFDDSATRRRRILALAQRVARRLGAKAPSPEAVIGYGPDGLPR